MRVSIPHARGFRVEGVQGSGFRVVAYDARGDSSERVKESNICDGVVAYGYTEP